MHSTRGATTCCRALSYAAKGEPCLTRRVSRASMRVMDRPPWESCPRQLIGRRSSCMRHWTLHAALALSLAIGMHPSHAYVMASCPCVGVITARELSHWSIENARNDEFWQQCRCCAYLREGVLKVVLVRKEEHAPCLCPAHDTRISSNGRLNSPAWHICQCMSAHGHVPTCQYLSACRSLDSTGPCL